MKILASRIEERGGGIAGAQNALNRWTSRRGWRLSLVDADGNVGSGEASPLPGYSQESFTEVGQVLGDLGSLWPLELGEEPLALAALLGEGRWPASAAFAFETAFLDLLAQARGWPLYRLLRDHSPPPLPLAALVASPAAAEQAWERGVRTFKVKLGENFAAELAFLTTLRRRYGAALALRLDANRAWSVQEFEERASLLQELAPEFLEEPVADPDTLEASPIPLALDESLQTPLGGRDAAVERRLARWATWPFARVLVLKPAALGGFTRCLALAAAAPHQQIVVSHLFDGPIALAAAAHLALALAPPQGEMAAGEVLAAGLDRHPGLAAWPAADLPWIGAATLVAPQPPGLGLRWLP